MMNPMLLSSRISSVLKKLGRVTKFFPVSSKPIIFRLVGETKQRLVVAISLPTCQLITGILFSKDVFNNMLILYLIQRMDSRVDCLGY